MSERKPAYPAHALEMHEDEDEDDKHLVRPTTRKEPHEEGRDQDIDDEDLAPLVPSRPPQAAQRQKKKDHQYGKIQLLYWDRRCQGTRASEETSILGKKSEGDALRNITNKLSDHMTTGQFKKRTTQLDIFGDFYDLCLHVVKICPFCNLIKLSPERSRVSGFRAEEFRDLIFFKSWVGKD